MCFFYRGSMKKPMKEKIQNKGKKIMEEGKVEHKWYWIFLRKFLIIFCLLKMCLNISCEILEYIFHLFKFMSFCSCAVLYWHKASPMNKTRQKDWFLFVCFWPITFLKWPWGQEVIMLEWRSEKETWSLGLGVENPFRSLPARRTLLSYAT